MNFRNDGLLALVLLFGCLFAFYGVGGVFLGLGIILMFPYFKARKTL